MLDRFTLLTRLKLEGFQAELFSVRFREYLVEWDRGLKSQSTDHEGYGLRIAKDGKVGFASSTVLNEELVKRAIESWKVSKVDNANVIPPGESGGGVSLKMFDFDSAVDQVKEAVKRLIDLPQWVVLEKASASIYSGTVEVASTEGSDKSSDFTMSIASVSGSPNSDDAITAFSYKSLRTLEPITSDAVKDEFLARLEIAKQRAELKNPPDTVTLTPTAVEELLVPLLRHAVSTEAVFRGNSPLKLNDVFSEKLTIVDNPLIPEAPGSRNFDGEGLPSKVNEIIRSGTFVKSLNTYYWALKANAEPTHSASRTYNTQPVTGLSTLEVKVKEVGNEEGLLIDSVRGVHTSDFSAGTFSVSVGLAWTPKEERAVKGLNLSGDLRALLRGVVAEAGEEEVKFSVKSKSIVVRGLKVLV